MKLLLKESTYWVGNGCGCCDPNEFSVFDVYVDGKTVEIQGHDVESALLFFLEELGYDVEIEYKEGE